MKVELECSVLTMRAIHPLAIINLIHLLTYFQNTSRSGHIPVLTAVGECPSGQVLCVDSNHAAIRIAQILQPRKVMFLNTSGGLVDKQGNVSVLYVTNRFHVVIHLFDNRSQMTSKFGKNKNVAHTCKPVGDCVTDVLTTFWSHLWSITVPRHGNMEPICLISIINK